METCFRPRRVQAAAGEQPHFYTFEVSVWNDDWGEHGENCISCHFGEFVSEWVAGGSLSVGSAASICPFHSSEKESRCGSLIFVVGVYCVNVLGCLCCSLCGKKVSDADACEIAEGLAGNTHLQGLM